MCTGTLKTKINFLDLNFSIEGSRFTTTTFFKQTDRNLYIPLDSCHYAPWLKSVPQGQFTRLRRNCTELEAYDNQAAVLSSRFVEKGYDQAVSSRLVQSTREMDRGSLLSDRVKEGGGGELSLPFITMFSAQHQNIKRLIRKHWHVLESDQLLVPILPERPLIVFRGASSLSNHIAPSIQDPPWENITFLQNLTGYHRCKKCQVCTLNRCQDRKISHFPTTSTSRSYEVEPFITCSSEGVVYLIQCPCRLQYIGRTKRALRVRLNEHIANIRKGFHKHLVSRHYDSVHRRDPSDTLFVGIDKYRPHWRGSSLVREISKQEMSWVYRLRTYLSYGLNVDTDI